MQHMAMHAGGSMHQHLPEVLADAAIHQHDNRHRVMMESLNVPTRLLGNGAIDANSPAETVVSSHRQAVSDPGRLRVIARAPDHIIEAIDDPTRAFYVGVQWHPERGGQGLFNSALFAQLVFAAAAAAFRAAT
jgi:putative glutamine amidotransferase